MKKSHDHVRIMPISDARVSTDVLAREARPTLNARLIRDGPCMVRARSADTARWPAQRMRYKPGRPATA